MKSFFSKINLLLVAILLFSQNAIHTQEQKIISEEAIQNTQSESTIHYSPLTINYKNIDLPGVERPEVEYYRRRYLGDLNEELCIILKNGEQYRHYIRRRLIEENMPLCIEFIPVIESSYRAYAKPSDGRSVGLWQFLEGSIENYMRKTEWFDERLDPWISTDAALAKLKDNYKTFGDWLLAIAAYNCGSGAVKRALAKSKEKTYWALSEAKLIPDHAINYIPKLLAISDIVTNSDYYKAGMPEFIYYGETYSPFDDFDYITVETMVGLKRLAMEMRIKEGILEWLNPALLYGVTPPEQKYKLRLPSGMNGAAADAIFSIMWEKKIADTK